MPRSAPGSSTRFPSRRTSPEVGLRESGQDADQGRFAAARGPDDAHELLRCTEKEISEIAVMRPLGLSKYLPTLSISSTTGRLLSSSK